MKTTNFLCFLLAFILILGALPVAAEADTVIRLVNKQSSMCLAAAQNKYNGQDITQQTASDAEMQTWTLKATSSGYFKLLNVFNGKGVGVWGGESGDNVRIVQWDDDNSFSQQWKLVCVDVDGEIYYKLKNRQSGKCIGIENSALTAGASAKQQTYDGNDSQLWSAQIISGNKGFESSDDSDGVFGIDYITASLGDSVLSYTVKSTAPEGCTLYTALCRGNSLLGCNANAASGTFTLEGDGDYTLSAFLWNKNIEPRYSSMSKTITVDNGSLKSPDVLWQSSTDGARWVDRGVLQSVPWDKDTAAMDASEELYIEVDQNVRYQTLSDNPWGGCFNERGWKAMERLSAAEREKIVGNLFGDDGLRFTTGRMPIGNSDFSINRSQSYDELPTGVETDYDLEHFSVDIDRDYLMPFIREAQKFRPNLPLWGSPWSPPSWMKTNKTIYEGGNLIWDEKVLTTYAHYFAEYVKAYRAEGFNVYMVMPQNEPTMNTAYSSCLWTGEQLNEFVRDYLSPVLREEGLSDVEIHLGTFTDSNATLVDPTLNDPETLSLIQGIGFQWWSAPLATRVYRQNLGLSFMQSETKCGNGGNKWSYAEEQFDCFREFFNAGVQSYMLWNMVLDESGANTSPNPWHQNAPIIVNSQNSVVTYSPSYYLTKHFSYFIKPHAGRIKTRGTYGDKIAFQNPDGENVLEVKNNSNFDYVVHINFNGNMISPTISAHSINTFRTAGVVTATTDATFDPSADPEETQKLRIRLTNKKSGKLLSVANASFDNGANVIIEDNKGESHQLWELRATSDDYYNFFNYNSQKVIGVWGGSTDDGASAIQWALESGEANQQWTLVNAGEDNYWIKNKKSGKCLGVKDASETSGAAVEQQTYSGAANQLWDVTVVSGSL